MYLANTFNYIQILTSAVKSNKVKYMYRFTVLYKSSYQIGVYISQYLKIYITTRQPFIPDMFEVNLSLSRKNEIS